MISKLDEAILDINKKFGKNSIKKVSEAKSLDYIRIPTGILPLDLAIGGGLPRGRVSELIGKKSTIKTTACKKTISVWQKYCRECSTEIKTRKNKKSESCKCGKNEKMQIIYIDSEGTYDKKWAEAIGVNNEEILLVQPENLEEVIEIIKTMIRTNKVDLIIFDSIASSVPIVEREKPVEDHNVGVGAKILNKMCRLITSSFNYLNLDCVNKPHIILINQPREKVGVMFGSNKTIPGGLGQEHLSSITIEFTHLAKIGEDGNKNPKNSPEDPVNIVGQMCSFEVQKNKTYPPFKKGWFTIYNQDCKNLNVKKGSFDNKNQLIRYLEYFQIITKDKNTYFYKEEKLGIKKQFLLLLEEEILYNKFYKLLLERI